MILYQFLLFIATAMNDKCELSTTLNTQILLLQYDIHQLFKSKNSAVDSSFSVELCSACIKQCHASLLNSNT